MTMTNLAATLTRFGARKTDFRQKDIPDFMMSRANAASWDMPDPGVYEAQAGLYMRLSWVYSAVQIVGQTCALQELNVKRQAG